MKNIKDVSLSRIRKFYRTLLFAALLLIMASSAASDSWFEQGSVSLTTYHLFDMGVARINSDQYFDIFTSNHSDNQGIFFGEHDLDGGSGLDSCAGQAGTNDTAVSCESESTVP